MTERERYDVAIVGYGPVGALAGLLLSEAGLRVAIVDREREIVPLPRAVGLDGESVRAFQRIGLGEAVAALLQPPREDEEICFTDSKRQRLFGLRMPDRGPMGWRDVSFFDQPELEGFLRDAITRRDSVALFLGREVVGIEQDANAVHVTHRPADGSAPDGSEERTLSASYLLGCDGASSFVRGACGIDWLSLGYDQDWLVIDIVQKSDARLPLDTMQVCDPERLTTYVCTKDPYRRWEFQLLPGETREQMLRPETIRSLLDPWLPPEHYELRRAAVYQFHAATAGRWRDGRVFLAGDAAHQTPPFLGQGLNAGFRDAVNLGWKLPLVLSGACDDALLETYEAERDAHARDLVEWAVAVGKLMETLAAREAGLPDPHEADERSGYGQGRTAPPLRSGVLVAEQLGDGSPVGGLLRQPVVRRPDGSECLFDELLGRGFAVVARKRSDLALGPEARNVLERLSVRCVSLEGLSATDGPMDALFDTHPSVVLRPDRYVFGVVDDDRDLDTLLVELAGKLQLRSVPG